MIHSSPSCALVLSWNVMQGQGAVNNQCILLSGQVGGPGCRFTSAAPVCVNCRLSAV